MLYQLGEPILLSKRVPVLEHLGFTSLLSALERRPCDGQDGFPARHALERQRAHRPARAHDERLKTVSCRRANAGRSL
jgi:hypothetical protein